LGVEIELGIVDRITGRLVPASNDVISELSVHHPGREHPKAKHELFLSTIEVITGVCQTVSEARADLAATVLEVQAALDRRGLVLMGGGVHPFADPKTLVRSSSKRYDLLVDRIRWPAERLQIHGTHFHVGVDSAEKSIQIMNHLIHYLPHFIALSASSPFWEGEDTGLASVRTKIFEAMPTAGLPSHFANWQAYEIFIEAMLRSGSITTVREIWWDMRPHALYGTIEFRMCDGIATLQEAAGLAALAQCLVEFLDQAVDEGRPAIDQAGWVVRENKWRAARWGLDADLVAVDGSTRPIRADIEQVIEELQPVARALNCVAELEFVRAILNGGASYERQRLVIAAGGGLDEVVAALVTEFAEGVSRG
jgi:carboxylate-amine ligase